MDANNTILTTPSDYAQKSHLTLFIFRKEGKHVLLRIDVWYRDADWSDHIIQGHKPTMLCTLQLSAAD